MTDKVTKDVRDLSANITDKIQSSTHLVAEASQEAISKSSNALQNILHYDQLPEWMRADPYIKLGYRRPLNRLHDCFWSLFYPHNELVNIWSHLLPAFLYLLSLLGVDIWTIHSNIEALDGGRVFFQVYVLCTFGCLLLSALYHCINAHSQQLSRQFLKFDYAGIILSIVGTTVSAAYFFLYGSPLLQQRYIVSIIASAVAVFYCLLGDGVDGPRAALQRYFQFHSYPLFRE